MDWIGTVIDNSGPTWWGAVIGVVVVFVALLVIYRIGTFDEKGVPDYDTRTAFLFVMPVVVILAFAIALFTQYALVCIAAFAIFCACLWLLARAAKHLAKLK